MENQTEVIKNQIATLTQGSELMVCATREDYEVLMRQEDVATAFKKQVEAYWDGTLDKPGPVKKAYDTWKDLTAKRGEMLKPLEAFVAVCRRVGGAYLAAEQRREQERLDVLRREAEEIRRQQEAELAAAADKLRQDHAAELASQAKALKNSPAELARQAEILRVQQAEDKAQLESAAKARMIDVSAIPLEAAKAEAGPGRTTTPVWTYDVVDEDLIPRSYLMIDESKIKKIVTAMKDKTNILGIRARMETSVRRTGK